MASCQRIETLPDAGKDLISELPVDVKQRILEWLPTRDAARTALLSTHWNHVWLRHGRLVFDSDFFRKCEGHKSTSVVNIINNILLLRVGPVKKFTLDISSFGPKLRQSDIDRWCLFLSRNGVEELNLSLYYPGRKYKLPVCIVFCPTIKKLKLCGFFLGFPVNAPCIFPGLTTLVFEHNWFKRDVNGIVSSIPKLEKLAFRGCNEIDNFEINAPKLRSLSAFGFIYAAESRWFAVHFEAIKVLCLSGDLLSTAPLSEEALTFPMAINLQVIELYDLSFACGKHFIFIMQLLQKSPNLCKLEILGTEVNWYDDKEAESRILEDPDSYVINQNLKMLNTVKIKLFRGSRLEMLFVTALLSKSPTLEKVVIQKSANMDTSMAFKIPRELLRFPCASPKAQLVFMECNSNYSLVGSPKF